jgi:hypothetical protein
MKYYWPMLAGERDPRSITYSLRVDRYAEGRWPEGRWSPTYDMVYMADNPSGLYDTRTREELPKLTAVLRPNVRELPDIIGEFSFNIAAPPPLVTHRLKALIEELEPHCCEYLPAPEIWDVTFNREVDRSDYQFAHVIRRLNSWNHEKSDIRKSTRRNGTVGYRLNGIGTVDPAAVRGHHLWRDSYTNHVLCSEEFKTRVEAASITNFHFEPMHVNS